MRLVSQNKPSGSASSCGGLHGVVRGLATTASSRHAIIVKFREDDSPVPSQPSKDQYKTAVGQPQWQTGEAGSPVQGHPKGGPITDGPEVAVLSPAEQLLLQQRIAELQTTDPYAPVNQGLPVTLADIAVIREAGKQQRQQHRLEEQGSQPGGQAPLMWPWWRPAFTRAREVIAGRAAMLGLALAAYQEIHLPCHPGILHQVSAATGASIPGAALALWSIAVSNTLAAVAPWSFTWTPENKQDLARRPPAPPSSWSPGPSGLSLAQRLRQGLGLSNTRGWGFSKSNELFLGRIAMLAFSATLYNEVMTMPASPGPLTQLAALLHIGPGPTYWERLPAVLASVAAAGLLIAYVWGVQASTHEDEDEVH